MEGQRYSKENTNVFFSIVIPCYNVEEAFINNAINSVIRQNFTNYEKFYYALSLTETTNGET